MVGAVGGVVECREEELVKQTWRTVVEERDGEDLEIIFEKCQNQ